QFQVAELPALLATVFGSVPLSVQRKMPIARRGLDMLLAQDGVVPVNHSGLADRRATQRVDGGSAGAIAAGRWARSRAGTALRRNRASVRALQRLGSILLKVRVLVRGISQ